VKALAQDAFKNRMVDSVEAGTQIALDKPLRRLSVPPDVASRRVAPTVGSEPMGAVTELRFIVGFQDRTEHLLQEFIRPTWEA
jgi:hypothetical protein